MTADEIMALAGHYAATVVSDNGHLSGEKWLDLHKSVAALVAKRDAAQRDNAKLRTVMIAAAEEISSHWDAHCDAEGYGPANLMHRLEEGIPSEYGYTAGAFAALKAAQADEIAAAVAFERERCAALCEMWNTSPGSSLAKEIRGGAEAGKPQAEPVAWMPILGTPFAVRMDALNERQAMVNHGQTLKRLAERGGLGMDEASAIAERRRWHSQATADAAQAIAAVAAAQPHQAEPIHVEAVAEVSLDADDEPNLR